ncbi:acetylcholine receptor subunit beta-like [Lineus longissimus]|uniref:acetylcholine receptor subunit beta-like n=1 Tax=Lineus longissimus TaxID=88925 RepID=UPI002B4EF7F6
MRNTTIGMLLLFLLVAILMKSSHAFHDEDSLTEYLLSGYGKKAHPSLPRQKPTVVRVSMKLGLLLELKDKEQQVSVATSINMIWNDSRLSWNASAHDNIRALTMAASDIWVPVIGHANRIDGKPSLPDHDGPNWLTVRSNGTINWNISGSLTAPCPVNAACFPFDVQKCQLHFIALKQSINSLKLEPIKSVDTNGYIRHSEWELIKSELKPKLEESGSTKSGFVLDMAVRRRHHYYMFSVIAPSTLVSVLILLVFYLPLDAGERMSFSVTIFLTFSLFQIMVTDRLPNASGSTSILAIYLFLQMVLSALSVVVSVLVLNMHYVYSQGSRMPRWMRRLFLGRLATCIGMRKTVKDSTNNNSIKLKIAENREKSMILRHHRLSEPGPASDVTNNNSNLNNQQNPRIYELVSAVHNVLREVKSISRRGHQVEASEKVQEEWRLGAMAIDRLMIIFCVAAVIASTLVCFLIIPRLNKDVCT